MIDSRDINALHPILQVKVQRLLHRAWEQIKVELIVLSTFRDEEAQQERWNVGRVVMGSKTSAARPMGQVLTDKPPGFSRHHYGLEIDVWPIWHGVPVTHLLMPEWQMVWRPLYRIARAPEINLQSEWRVRLSSGNRQHGNFHYTAGLTVDQLRCGLRVPNVTI